MPPSFTNQNFKLKQIEDDTYSDSSDGEEGSLATTPHRDEDEDGDDFLALSRTLQHSIVSLDSARSNSAGSAPSRCQQQTICILYI